jgi:hypothetical protein
MARLLIVIEAAYNSARHGRWVSYDSCIVVPDLGSDDVPPGTEVWSVDPPLGFEAGEY